jgi:phosphomevalonate kinase
MILDQYNTIYTKACGKVLIAGGYGVLEKYNIGLTLAL